MNREERDQIKDLMEILGTEKLMILEVRGEHSEDEINEFVKESLEDCIDRGLLTLDEDSENMDDDDIEIIEYPDELPFVF